MIQRRTMRPSIVRINEQLDPRFAASRHTTALINHTRPLPRSSWATTHACINACVCVLDDAAYWPKGRAADQVSESGSYGCQLGGTSGCQETWRWNWCRYKLHRTLQLLSTTTLHRHHQCCRGMYECVLVYVLFVYIRAAEFIDYIIDYSVKNCSISFLSID